MIQNWIMVSSVPSRLAAGGPGSRPVSGCMTLYLSHAVLKVIYLICCITCLYQYA